MSVLVRMLRLTSLLCPTPHLRCAPHHITAVSLVTAASASHANEGPMGIPSIPTTPLCYSRDTGGLQCVHWEVCGLHAVANQQAACCGTCMCVSGGPWSSRQSLASWKGRG